MAIQNRETTLPGIWAETAQTEIPTPPVAGVTYRDTTLNSTAIEKAWPFKTIVDSSDFNQHAFLQDMLIKEAEQYGVMRWNNSTEYKEGGFCLAQDGKIYQAIRDNQGKEPTASPDDWKIPFAIDADIVHKTGDEAIDGYKTIIKRTRFNNEIILADTKGTAPDNPPSSTASYGTLRWIVKAIEGNTEGYGGGQELFRIQPVLNENGKLSVVTSYVYGNGQKPTFFSFGCDADGANPFFYVPTPGIGSGWFRIGSLLIQWGNGTVDTRTTLTFPKPFANTNYSIVLTGKAIETSGLSTWHVKSGYGGTQKTTTSVVIVGSIDTSLAYSWFAIGQGA